MDKRTFERALWQTVKAYWGTGDPNDKRGSDYQWLCDDLTVACSDEQWQIVEDTFEMLRDPDYMDKLIAQSKEELAAPVATYFTDEERDPFSLVYKRGIA